MIHDIRDICFEREVERIVALGPRSVVEMLREIGAGTLRMTAIEDLVATYVARINPEALRLAGGDRLPRSPVHLVLRSGQ